MPIFLTVAVAMLAASANAQAVAHKDCLAAETLASYPHGNFLENLIVERDNRVLFTSYVARQIEMVRPDTPAATFAELPAHPVSLLPLGKGYLVAAHGKSFLDGPEFLKTNRFLILDHDGKVTRSIPAVEARFLNGMARLNGGDVLIADSVLGLIWRLNVATGSLTNWLDLPEMKPDASGQDQRPGVNGLKIAGNRLYFSNSFTGQIWSVALSRSGKPVGAPTIHSTPGRVDDFVITRDGSAIAATHADTVVKVRGSAAPVTVLSEGGDGSTAVAYANKQRSAIYVLTTGRLLEGGTEPARLLRVSLASDPKVCQ